MLSGIEIIHNEGRTQLSHDFTYFNLYTKVEINGLIGWSQYGTTGSYQDVIISGISLADAPLAALSSAAGTYCEQINATSNSVTYRVYRKSSGNHSVWLYIFTVTASVISTEGLEIYDASGVLRFSANGKWCKIMGVYADGVYNGKSRTGRSCAHVPQKQMTSQYNIFTRGNLGSCTIGGGIQGYQVYQQTGWSRSVILCDGDLLSQDLISMQQGPFPVQCSTSSVIPSSSSSESPKYQSIIIDVTGY